MNKTAVVSLLRDARSVLARSVIITAICSVICFFFSRQVMVLLMHETHTKLYYFNISEVFISSVELAIYMGLFFSVPLIAFYAWRRFHSMLGDEVGSIWPFVAFSIILFYAGCVFCYFFVLPSGIGFLLSYEGYGVKAMISTKRFIKFCTTMIFAFGAAFELPIILLVLQKFGIVSARKLASVRRYAILAVVIAAAVITPTPDVYNMSLLGVPLYLLYEISIVIMKMRERTDLTLKSKSG